MRFGEVKKSNDQQRQHKMWTEESVGGWRCWSVTGVTQHAQFHRDREPAEISVAIKPLTLRADCSANFMTLLTVGGQRKGTKRVSVI